MSLKTIATIADLRSYLQTAIQLEHATLPPYLVALYSLRPGTNAAAYQQIRMVAVEEMLHLTLAANLLNAVGGKPDLTRPDFVPRYPAYLPNGETDFKVDVSRFNPEALDDFLQIERPARPEDHEQTLVERPARPSTILPTVKAPDGSDLHFCTIGEFYAEIGRRLEDLEAEAQADGETIFTGDPAHQISPEYYYSGGAAVVAVRDLETAREAINLISEQGEGYEGSIFDHQGELSHYYRFQQLKLNRSYLAGDEVDHPTGESMGVDWDGVYPVKTNAHLSDYPEGSAVRAAVLDCYHAYQGFLARITEALTGRPDLLIPAVGDMFRLKEKFYHLMHNPIPGEDGVHAAPVFGPLD